jgi:hypothetical protein
MRNRGGVSVLLMAGICALAGPALAADTPASVAALLSGDGLTAATTTVLTLFLIAVLLESALAVLFNWRPFVETFNARATRPLLAFLVAWLFVDRFDYDAVTALMNAVQGGAAQQPRMIGRLLTAAILAGGSSGVNTVLVSLGFREVRTQATEMPKVTPDKAWIAVRAEQVASEGDVLVRIGQPGANPDDALPLAGVINGGRGTVTALGRFFLRDRNRFPAFGGYEVPSGQPCRILLSARRKDGGEDRIASAPLDFVPAKGAIIDLTVRL